MMYMYARNLLLIFGGGVGVGGTILVNLQYQRDKNTSNWNLGIDSASDELNCIIFQCMLM